MRIGIFGGSFNPVHNAHLRFARQARKKFKLDRIVFVPSGRPPHKSPSLLASKPDRLKMLRLALAGSGFSVSDHELRKKSISYSWDTIRYFRKRFPKAQLHFLLGADALSGIKTWKRGERILDEARFIVAARPGRPLGRLPKRVRDKVWVLPFRESTLSASLLRRRAARGLSLAGLTPPSVTRFIRAQGLYGSRP